ncbi:DUF167 domain-containing protein [Methanocalculus sp.]|uniref:DUF167 domain-containing protein n=1 Tax=Methanocalculus sp. TaxID=2004547 RepID=UPI002723E3CB|nr:DUF167 domain-containing protein [Methanocalculus sp.]MDO8841872.1 DUF167 domain-containing protein [Methanocalculus sp.]
MDSFIDALRATDDGLLIKIEVQTGSGRNVFPSGYNPWRKTIGVAVTAPPVDGRANTAIIDLVADSMHVPRSSVNIMSGHQSSKKVIRIANMTLLQGIEILRPFFDE